MYPFLYLVDLNLFLSQGPLEKQSPRSPERRAILNTSITNAVGFYIVAFTHLEFTNIYLIFLAVVYFVTVLSNSFILSIILIDNRLHTPKYIAVANLAIVDLIFSTTLIPSMIKVFLAKDNFISYNACLTQFFFLPAFSH